LSITIQLIYFQRLVPSVKQNKVFINQPAGRDAAPPCITKNTEQPLHPFIAIKKTGYKTSDSSCALAGQTGGAIRLSLIFLFLFPSREKEKKGLLFFMTAASPEIILGLL